MDCVDVSNFRCADNPVGAEVAFGALISSDADRFVGELNVEGLHIRFRIDREGLDTKLATGADDAKGDFTAVGDENFLNHRKEENGRSGEVLTERASPRARTGRVTLCPEALVKGLTLFDLKQTLAIFDRLAIFD